jgi:hypothetical protein
MMKKRMSQASIELIRMQNEGREIAKTSSITANNHTMRQRLEKSESSTTPLSSMDELGFENHAMTFIKAKGQCGN